MDLFESHERWAVRLAFKFASRFGYLSQLSEDEVKNMALVALWGITRRYDPALGGFKVYAAKRIIGALKDEYRQHGFARDLRRGPLPEDSDNEALRDGLADKNQPTPLDEAMANEKATQNKLEALAIIEMAPTPRHEIVVWLRYLKGMTYRQIGECLKISEARASQIFTEAMKVIRMRVERTARNGR